jgi:hypothetical protein
MLDYAPKLTAGMGEGSLYGKIWQIDAAQAGLSPVDHLVANLAALGGHGRMSVPDPNRAGTGCMPAYAFQAERVSGFCASA